jgi:hypothetical protein
MFVKRKFFTSSSYVEADLVVASSFGVDPSSAVVPLPFGVEPGAEEGHILAGIASHTEPLVVQGQKLQVEQSLHHLPSTFSLYFF